MIKGDNPLQANHLEALEKAMRYHFCPHCGGKLSLRRTQDLNKPQCLDCEQIFYQNPAVGVAAIILLDGKILLGKRNGSYSGMWCIPCGYVEYDEGVRAALVREIKEETNLDLVLGEVYAVHSNFHNPLQHSVGIWYMAESYTGELAPRDDLEELAFYTATEIHQGNLPLAFPTDEYVLEDLVRSGLLR